LSLENILLSKDDHQFLDSTSSTHNFFGGELFLLRLEDQAQGAAIADLCSGLITPVRGTVRFLGRDWSRVAPDSANAMRGKIGRTHSQGAWIDKLTLRENILMSQLHHTRRSEDAVQLEACEYAVAAGLPGVPCGFPEEAIPSDLERAAWIRAFLGTPLLVLLEEPVAAWPMSGGSCLINLIRKARTQGAVVIWMTGQDGPVNDATIPATHRYHLVGRQLVETSST